VSLGFDAVAPGRHAHFVEHRGGCGEMLQGLGTAPGAVLDVRVSGIRLAGQGSVNPPMTLLMTAPVTIFRKTDGTVLYTERFEYKSLGAHKFVEWAADDGLAFREEVDRGARSLADDIVRVLFAPAPSRDDTPTEQSTPPEQGSDEAAPEPQFPVSPKPGEATR
jgi:hypothetical protein